MFPTNGGSNAETELDRESLPNNSVSQEQEESTNATFQGYLFSLSHCFHWLLINTTPNNIFMNFLLYFYLSCVLPSEAVEDTNLIPGSSSMGAAKISSSETIGVDQNDLTGSADNLVATQSTAPKVNLQGVPIMVKSENGCKVEVHDSELSFEMGCVVFELHFVKSLFSCIFIVFCHHIAD